MSTADESVGYRGLAGYRRCIERMRTQWPRFCETREDRLRRVGATEKVAEAILEALFTEVLDWSKGDMASNALTLPQSRPDI